MRWLLPLLLLLPAVAWGAGPVTNPTNCELEWTAPTKNTDGSALTDLAGYNLYIGVAAGVFPAVPIAVIPSPKTTPTAGDKIAWKCVGLTDGQKWVTVRAVDLALNESPNATVDPVTGGSTANGLPFVFDALQPAAPPSLRLKTP